MLPKSSGCVLAAICACTDMTTAAVVCARRDDAVRVLTDAFAAIARPSTKAGFVKDVLVSR
jgi:hypothetical protein